MKLTRQMAPICFWTGGWVGCWTIYMWCFCHK